MRANTALPANEKNQHKTRIPALPFFLNFIVLAKKKSGELRLRVDFRKLNSITKKLVYPLPNIEDCIETLADKTY